MGLSRIASFGILLRELGQQTQRLAGHPDSVVKKNILGCEVPGRWPLLWILQITVLETAFPGWRRGLVG